MMRWSLIAVPLILLYVEAEAFYLPGVNPRSFAEGESIPLLVNKLTSTKKPVSLDYYHLPFCQPEGGPTVQEENLGQLLAGDRIQTSPYELKMKTDMYCQQLCVVDLGEGEVFKKAIHDGYRNNWILDNLPSASKVEDDSTITTRYWGGIPIGFFDSHNETVYIHNHVNIEVMYHAPMVELNRYHVVRFTVEPFSIRHDFDSSDAGKESEEEFHASIQNPINSCRRDSELQHTNYDMVTAKGRGPQLAMGKVLFTYDVIWIENRDLHWVDRWDIYLSMDDAVPFQVHWFSSMNSIGLAFILGTLFMSLLIRDLRYRADHLAQEESEEETHRRCNHRLCERAGIIMATMVVLITFGALFLLISYLLNELKFLSDGNAFEAILNGVLFIGSCVLVGVFALCVIRDLRYQPLLMHDTGDEEDNDGNSAYQELLLWPLSDRVFSTPKCAPLVLSVLYGTGAQLHATMILCATVFAFRIVAAPIRGGSIMLILIVYTLMGSVGGFVTASLYKAYGGYLKGTLLAASASALCFPGLLVVVWVVVDEYLKSQEGATDTLLPNSSRFVLLGGWLGVMVPITVASAFCTFRKGISKKFPNLHRSDEATPVAATASTRNRMDTLPVRLVISGLLPLSAIYLEYYFFVASILQELYYFTPFVLVAALLYTLMSALVSLLLWYRQLRSKNYEWWWLSFSIGPSSGAYFFLLSIALGYFQWTSARWIYLCVTGVVSIGIACMMGFVGLGSCLVFNAWRYSASGAYTA